MMIELFDKAKRVIQIQTFITILSVASGTRELAIDVTSSKSIPHCLSIRCFASQTSSEKNDDNDHAKSLRFYEANI